MKWRAALVALLLVIAVASDRSHVEAKGNAVAVAPDSGPAGTRVELSSRNWNPDVEVRIYAAFSSSLDEGYTGSLRYIGPVATAQSNAEGDWSLPITIDSAMTGLALPGEPGYIFFKAESDEMFPYLGDAQVADFALVINGRRPPSSGEIRVSITLAPGVPDIEHERLAFFGWRLSPGDTFFTPYSVIPVPFETRIPRVADGDWEVTVISPTGLRVVGEEPTYVVNAVFCRGVGVCAAAQDLTVKTASVRDGGPVEANFVLDLAPVPTAAPRLEANSAIEQTASRPAASMPSKSGSGGSGLRTTLIAASVAAVSVGSVAASGYVLYRRRTSR